MGDKVQAVYHSGDEWLDGLRARVERAYVLQQFYGYSPDEANIEVSIADIRRLINEVVQARENG